MLNVDFIYFVGTIVVLLVLLLVNMIKLSSHAAAFRVGITSMW